MPVRLERIRIYHVFWPQLCTTKRTSTYAADLATLFEAERRELSTPIESAISNGANTFRNDDLPESTGVETVIADTLQMRVWLKGYLAQLFTREK